MPVVFARLTMHATTCAPAACHVHRADKSGYPDYARWASRHLRRGGLSMVANAYVFGHLIEHGEEAKCVRMFDEFVAQHFDSVCIPTPERHGL